MDKKVPTAVPAKKPAGEKKAGAPKEKPAPASEKLSPASQKIVELVKKSFSSWVSHVDELKSKSANEIYSMYSKELERIKKEFPTKSEMDLNKRAMRNFKLSFKQKNVGGRTRIEGRFLGYKGYIDAVKKRRAEALAKAAVNPKEAVKKFMIKGEMKDGKTIAFKDKNGKYIPIENREFYENFKDKITGELVPNKNYMKELPEHSHSQTYFGIFSIDGGDPELAFYAVRGDAGAPGAMEIPMDVPVSFYAHGSDRTDTSTGLKIISGFKTKFEKIDKKMPGIFELFEQQVFENFFVELATMNEWFESHRKDFNHFFVADINVLQKTDEKSSNGTFRIVVDDDSLGFSKEDDKEAFISLNGFVSGLMEDKYKMFGEKSRLIVIGSANRNWKKDSENKFVLDENNEKILDDPVLSIWGFDFDPEFLEKPREVKEMKEKDEESDSEESVDEEISKAELEDDDDKKKPKLKDVDAEVDTEDEDEEESDEDAEDTEDEDEEEEKPVKKAPKKAEKKVEKKVEKPAKPVKPSKKKEDEETESIEDEVKEKKDDEEESDDDSEVDEKKDDEEESEDDSDDEEVSEKKDSKKASDDSDDEDEDIEKAAAGKDD